jgi:hypothetical protein
MNGGDYMVTYPRADYLHSVLLNLEVAVTGPGHPFLTEPCSFLFSYQYSCSLKKILLYLLTVRSPGFL